MTLGESMSNDDLTTTDASSDEHGPGGDPAGGASGGLSRRRLLGGAAAGASALLVANSQIGRAAAATVSEQRGRLPRDPAASGIDHVIVVMMENRSFDHYLGWVPGADGPRAKQKYRTRRTWPTRSGTSTPSPGPPTATRTTRTPEGWPSSTAGPATAGWWRRQRRVLDRLLPARGPRLLPWGGPLLDRLRPLLRVDPRADLPEPHVHARGPDRPDHQHHHHLHPPDHLGLAGQRRPRRPLLLLRRPDDRAVGQQVLGHQPSVRQLPHRLRSRRPAVGQLHRSPLPHDRERAPGRRPPPRGHPRRPVVPQPGLRSRDRRARSGPTRCSSSPTTSGAASSIT